MKDILGIKKGGGRSIRNRKGRNGMLGIKKLREGGCKEATVKR